MPGGGGGARGGHRVLLGCRPGAVALPAGAAPLPHRGPPLSLPEETAGQVSQAEQSGDDQAGTGPGGSPHHQLPSLQSPALRPSPPQIRGHLDLRNSQEMLQFIKRSK